MPPHLRDAPRELQRLRHELVGFDDTERETAFDRLVGSDPVAV